MAKVITTELQHSGASAANITLDSSKNVTAENNLQVDGNLTVTGTSPQRTQPFRNILINGDFRISQRNGTTSTAMTDGLYNIDRWCFVGASSRITTQQVEDGPTGFKYCMKAVSVGANTPDAADALWYKLEGYDVKPLEYGTAGALTTTLSFWFKASATGTYGGSIQKHTLDRSVPFSFTVSAADTWEKKTITIPGDTTSSTYRDTNLFSVSIKFSTGCASGYLDTAGTWVGSDKRGATGTTQIQATNAAYFSVTGIQWEIGSTATDYEHKSYNDEFLACQRYFRKYGGAAAYQRVGIGYFSNTTRLECPLTLAPVMRTTPTMTVSDAGHWKAESPSGSGEFTAVGIDGNSSKEVAIIWGDKSSSFTAGESGRYLADNTTDARIYLSAEL